MKRYSMKQLKELVKKGDAVDITKKPYRTAIPESYKQIGYCSGAVGCTGLLLEGESGQLYTIIGRYPSMWIFS